MSKIIYQTSLSAISGFLLYNIRREMGLGQSDMGKLFNISHATYRSIEKGETAVNSDFIFMLCSLTNINFSDYFSLISDISVYLNQIEKDYCDNDCVIQLIPNGDFQKLIKTYGSENYSVSLRVDEPNILFDQDFNLFFSPALRIRIRMMTEENISHYMDYKKIIKTTSTDIENSIQTLKEKHENISIPSFVFKSSINQATVVGLDLYKMYKKTKEVKKAKIA